MIVEMQVEAGSFVDIIRGRVVSARTPVPQPFPNPLDQTGNNPWYLDHWSLEDTTFSLSDPDTAPLGGHLGIDLPFVRLTQSITGYFAVQQALKDWDQRAGGSISDYVPVGVTFPFDIIAGVGDGGDPNLTVTLGTPTNTLNLAMDGYTFSETYPFDLSKLPHIPGGDVPSIENVGLATNHDGSVLALRIEVNDQAPDAAERWSAFMNGQFDDLLQGTRVAVFIDEELIRQPMQSMLAAGLQDKNGVKDSGDFWLEKGPTVTWSPLGLLPRFVANASGEVIDGCAGFFGPVDMDVDATISVTVTVPQDNDVHIEADLDVSLNGWEELECALALAFFPITTILCSASWVNDIALEGIFAIDAGPAGVFIALGIVASDPLMVAGGQIPTPQGFTKVDDGTYVMDFTFSPPDGEVISDLRVSTVMATDDGVIFRGSFHVAPVPAEAVLAIEPWADKAFTWQTDDPCNQSAPTLEATLPFAPTTGTLLVAPPVIKSAANPAYEVAFEEWDENGIKLELFVLDPDAAISDPFEILLITNGGARYLTLPIPASLKPFANDQEALGYATNLILYRVEACYMATSIWGKLGIFNPHWTVDPGPEGDASHVWSIVVDGLAGSQVTLADARGEAIAGCAPAGRGAIGFQATTMPVTDGPELTLARDGVRMPFAEYVTTVNELLGVPATYSTSRLSIGQTSIVPVGRIALPAPEVGLSLTNLAGAHLLAVATEAGVVAYRLSPGEAPVQVSEMKIDGLRGVCGWGSSIVAWGQAGIVDVDVSGTGAPGRSPVRRTSTPGFGPARASGEPVIAVVPDGPILFVLTAAGVTPLGADGPVGATVALEGGVDMVGTTGRLVVATKGALRAFDVRRPSRPVLSGWADVPAAHLRRLSGVGASTSVVAEDGAGAGVVVDFSRPGRGETTVRYERLPWIVDSVAAAGLVAHPEPDRRAIVLRRIGAQARTRSDGDCGCSAARVPLPQAPPGSVGGSDAARV